jgi:hypothetical protein
MRYILTTEHAHHTQTQCAATLKNFNFIFTPHRFRLVAYPFSLLINTIIMNRFLLTVTAVLAIATAISQNNHTSLLSEGDWYKVKVVEQGVHKITYQHLESTGINMQNIIPANIRMFGNGGDMLPLTASAPAETDFEEIAIYVHGQNSGIFGPDDYILFYGESTTAVIYDESSGRMKHQLNYYADTSCYFLTIGSESGRRIATIPQPFADTTHTITSFPDYVFHEQQLVNLLHMGREWLGEEFNDQTPQNFVFNLPKMLPGSNATIHWEMAAYSPEITSFKLMLNGNLIDSMPINSSISPYTAAISSARTIEVQPTGNELTLTLHYDFNDPDSKGWLNRLGINFMSELKAGNDQIQFRDPYSVGPENIGYFIIADASEDHKVWDISNHQFVAEVESNFIPASQTIEFRLPVEELREFIVFSQAELIEPAGIVPFENQNIRGMQAAEMLIIFHPEFTAEVMDLKNFHETHTGLMVNTVDVTKIYNEFSSGKQDVAAIRNMIRLFNDKGSSKNQNLQYVIIFGMGSYDFKNIDGSSHNTVPVFQSLRSFDQVDAFASDDFFALLEDGKGNWDAANPTVDELDVAIGRITAKTTGEARWAVDKIISYGSNPDRFGPWRIHSTFIADDGDNSLHMRMSDSLSAIFDRHNPVYNQYKIYLDEYELEQTANGPAYPDVNVAIVDAINQGVSVFNYAGHSGKYGLARENVLTMDDIELMDNAQMLPVFFVFGSSFVNISDPETDYVGNRLLLNEHNGAVALLSPVSAVYAGSNYQFCSTLLTMFEQDEGPQSFGELVRSAKNETINIQNRRYSLLGDPALKLSLPVKRVTIDSLNGIAYESFSDTLHPSQQVIIKGKVTDRQGMHLTGFNGNILLNLYDRAYTDTTRGNQNPPHVFNKRDIILLTAETTVQNGVYELQFQLPSDLNQDYDSLKFSFYAFTDNADAAGFEYLMAGGSPSGMRKRDLNRETVKVYPSISKGPVNVVFTAADHNFSELRIINMAGNEVKRLDVEKQTRVQLDLSASPRGVYIMIIHGHDIPVHRKLILN